MLLIIRNTIPTKEKNIKMKNLKLILLILLSTAMTNVKCQQILTLESCYEDALLSHPLAQEKEIHTKLWQLKDMNITSEWYPSLNAGANILYNTDVVEMEGLPIPGMPHDQYKLAIDINQVIYDGGAIKGNRELEKASMLVSEQEVEIVLYKIREQVNNTFFGLIMLNKQEELLLIYLDLFEIKIKSIESAIENDLLLPSDKSVVVAEKIKLEQQLREIKIGVRSATQILSDLTGREIPVLTEPVLPDITINHNPILERPELYVFELRQNQLEAGKSLIKSSRMPKAYGFATVGYGQPPGSDFFTDSFDTYAVLGAGIKWNIFDWNKSKRSLQMIDLNKTIISSRKEEMEDNLRRALENKYSEIVSFETMLESDKQLIDLRRSITRSGESQFRNGTITSTEYMSILNKEKEAMLSHHIHLVSCAKAKVEYLNIAGNEIK